MATLETQYKNYCLTNPDTTLTFGEWRTQLGRQLHQAFLDLQDQEARQIMENRVTKIELINAPTPPQIEEGDF